LSDSDRETGVPVVMTADSTVRAVNEALETGDHLWAFKMVVQGRDHLRLLLTHGDGPLDSWAHRSVRVVDRRYDLLLRALVAHEFAEHGQPGPRWAGTERLAQPWLLENPVLRAERTREQTPHWLCEINIYIAERDLFTA
jgi:hypothetical protein